MHSPVDITNCSIHSPLITCDGDTDRTDGRVREFVEALTYNSRLPDW